MSLTEEKKAFFRRSEEQVDFFADAMYFKRTPEEIRQNSQIPTVIREVGVEVFRALQELDDSTLPLLFAELDTEMDGDPFFTLTLKTVEDPMHLVGEGVKERLRPFATFTLKPNEVTLVGHGDIADFSEVYMRRTLAKPFMLESFGLKISTLITRPLRALSEYTYGRVQGDFYHGKQRHIQITFAGVDVLVDIDLDVLLACERNVVKVAASSSFDGSSV